MKSIITTLCAILFLAATASAQAITGERFMQELKYVMDDANDGFVKIKASDNSEQNWINLIYPTSYQMLGGTTSYIYYNEESYLKYSKETVPESYYYFQTFNNGTPAGKFMSDSAEILLDAYADKYHLKKKTSYTTDDKQARKEHRGIRYEYMTPDKQRIVSLKRSDMKRSDEPYYSTDLYVYSSRKNTSRAAGPALLGCMVYSFSGMDFLYVVPVYGAGLGDKEKVAAAAYAKSGLVESRYQYEWMPGLSAQQVETKWEKQKRVQVMNAYTIE